MSYFIFAKNILNDGPIPIFNNGNLSRDFTYVDDIVKGLTLIIEKGYKPNEAPNRKSSIYNIGRGQPINIMDFVNTIGENLGKKPLIELLPMQDGDVYTTWTDTGNLQKIKDIPLILI